MSGIHSISKIAGSATLVAGFSAATNESSHNLSLVATIAIITGTLVTASSIITMLYKKLAN